MPTIAPMYRLQFEPAQNAWVLLYPEGMVKLNDPAAEILRRCSGTQNVQQLIAGLERDYRQSDLSDDICEFLSDAYGRGWII
ncbi:pyrroloquinoline quinone biosynthesis peptide chaperone PqqD [Eleftheria terrae]|uniref:pyrroloquinoline quinone biosynthesis peptide chaperone PqqD n=1 Tax=Eleftheria terrae TaxID=1597781 RepID=UPI00263B7A24|nr:pyrroloquinoline quinone biosynthesis peptide chaperone PqqD [Eleftheria terrae]WKB55143.1 pyrroloquinoline quinone biosynthesis peptide chaperone PqqD [Eleftheria terrae]